MASSLRDKTHTLNKEDKRTSMQRPGGGGGSEGLGVRGSGGRGLGGFKQPKGSN